MSMSGFLCNSSTRSFILNIYCSEKQKIAAVLLTLASILFLLYVLPIIFDACATPTIHTLLFAFAAIIPATAVPWLYEETKKICLKKNP